MSAHHLSALWRAETIKLVSRTGARAGLLLAAVLGLVGPLVLYSLGQSEITINGGRLADTLQLHAPMGTQWALVVRNFFLLRAFIILLGALSFAGEFQARTLREDLLRPVPRWSVIGAKWGALVTWIVLTEAVSFLIAGVVGLLCFGFAGASSWGGVALGYLATALCDAGFAALVLAIAVALRSVAATVMGVFLFLLLDTLLGWVLGLLSMMANLAEFPVAVELALQARPWLPSAAFGAWDGFMARAEWTWQSFASLGILTVLALVFSERWFARMDVP